MSKLHVCVDWMALPSGSVIVMGSLSILMLIAWAPSTRKWLVAPESLNALLQRVVVCGCCCGASDIVIATVLGSCMACLWAASFVVRSISSSSSDKMSKGLLDWRVNVGVIGVAGKHRLRMFILSSTSNAPPCQA